VLLEDCKTEVNDAAARSVIVRPGTKTGLIVSCEHAGKLVPSAWNDLGLSADYFQTHYSHDIGAGSVADRLGELLDVCVISAKYSRLFYDINRQPRSWDSIRPDMGGIPVPGNQAVSDEERTGRDRISREPFDNAVLRHLQTGDVLIAIHSFSPVYDGNVRKAEIGVMRDNDCLTCRAVLDALKDNGDFVVGDNEPYDLRKVPPGTTKRIQSRINIPAVIIEIRNDIISHDAGIEAVSQTLAKVLRAVVSLKPGRVA
jgi:predicted N-formylglutamate amidohydrolase